MSHLNSLCCSACDRNYISPAAAGNYWLPVACQHCANILCRHGCSSNLSICCGTAMREYKPLNVLIYLLNSPIEEIRRTNFEVCTSSSCRICGASGTLYRRTIRELYCAQCCDKNYFWSTNSPLEALYLKLFADVRSVTNADYSDLLLDDGGSTISIFPSCPRCTESCEVYSDWISCPCCLTLDVHDCQCLIAFMLALGSIPEKHLPSLSYETWAKSFSCSKCKDIYKETYNMVIIHVCNGNTCRETPLHEMLKGERVPNGPTLTLVQALTNKYLAEKPRSTVPTQRPKTAMKLIVTREQSNYNDLPPSSTNFKVQLPTKMMCKCGRVDELKDMFDCLTCSEYGICGVCGLRNHKKHEIEETIKSVVSTVVSGCSEKTLRRISKWAEEYRQLNTEFEANYAKLCGLLGSTFKEAYTCGKLERAAEIFSECDISAVESHVKKLFKTKKEASEAIGELCARLQKLRSTE